MELDVNGEIVAAPTAGDVARGIDGRDGQKAWYLILTRPDGFYLEVQPSDIGTSDMLLLANGNEEQHLRHIADAPVAPDEAKAILADFLNGGTAWRERWTSTGARATDKALTGQDTFSMPAMNWVVGFVGLGLGLFYFLQSGYLLAACLVMALLVMIGNKALHADGRTSSALSPNRICRRGCAKSASRRPVSTIFRRLNISSRSRGAAMSARASA